MLPDNQGVALHQPVDYEPIFMQTKERRFELNKVLNFLENASNYELYCIQQRISPDTIICTYNPMVWLPSEVLNMVLQYLDIPTLLAMVQLNRTWRRYLRDHPVWRISCLRIGLSYPITSERPRPHLLSRKKQQQSCVWHCRAKAAMSVYNAMSRNFFTIKSISNQKVTRQNHGVSDVRVRGSLLCIYRCNVGWVVYDIHLDEELWRHNCDDLIDEFRFVETNRCSPFTLSWALPHGALVYSNSEGRVTAVVPKVRQPSRFCMWYKIMNSVMLRVVSCDMDLDLQLVAALCSQPSRCFYLWDLQTGTARYVQHLHLESLHIHFLLPFENQFSLLVTAIDGIYSRFYWPSHKGNVEAQREVVNRINPLSMLLNESPLESDHCGDYLSMDDCSEQYIETRRGSNVRTVVQKESATIAAMSSEANEKSNLVMVLCANTLQLLHRVTLGMKIVQMLAASRRFALLLTISKRDFTCDSLILFDLVKRVVLNTLDVERVKSKCYGGGRGPGDTLWMDTVPVDLWLAANGKPCHAFGSLDDKWDENEDQAIASTISKVHLHQSQETSGSEKNPHCSSSRLNHASLNSRREASSSSSPSSFVAGNNSVQSPLQSNSVGNSTQSDVNQSLPSDQEEPSSLECDAAAEEQASSKAHLVAPLPPIIFVVPTENDLVYVTWQYGSSRKPADKFKSE